MPGIKQFIIQVLIIGIIGVILNSFIKDRWIFIPTLSIIGVLIGFILSFIFDKDK